MIYVAEPNTDEWRAARRTGIGASQAAAACNVSPYSTPLKVYMECRGEIEPDPDNKHTRFGRFMEPGIVAMYQDEFGVELQYPMPMVRHDRWEFMLATPDAEESPKKGVEIKTIDLRRPGAADLAAGKIDLVEVCPEYVVQAQQQCAVMEWDTVNVAMLIGKDLKVFPVDRDDEMIEMIAAHESDLWKKIQAGIRPAPTNAVDLDVLRRRKKIIGKVVPISSAAARRWERYEWCGKLINKLNERRDLLKAEVLMEVGDAPAGLLPDGVNMIRRAIINKKSYTVAASQSLDVRKVKYDGSPLAVPQSLPAAS